MANNAVVSIKKLALKAWAYAHVGLWALSYRKYDADFVPKKVSEKFKSARDLVASIPSGAVIGSAFLGAHGRPSLFYLALRDHYAETKQPQNLTWINNGAPGGRGVLPGSIDELSEPGLLKCVISGHMETMRTLRKQADAGHFELHTMPQGEFAFLIEGQQHGKLTRRTTTGIGTFLDPRVGPGTVVAGDDAESLIKLVGDELEYRLPAVEIALLTAPWADRDGNIYLHGTSSRTEILDMVDAAKANGGKVYFVVAQVGKRPPGPISIPAERVDGIVVNRYHEQIATVKQRNHWQMFVEGPENQVPVVPAIERVRAMNEALRASPRRDAVDDAMARLAAKLFVSLVKLGDWVNIGTGLPEEVSRLMYAYGVGDDVVFSAETGVVGGVPTAGGFFGAAINPISQLRSSQLFGMYQKKLRATCLGMLEFDELGNVNSSRIGPGAEGCIGPGGFTNMVCAADTIVFVGRWMAKAKFVLDGGQVRIVKPGKAKLVKRVREITFNAQQALESGVKVYYVTNVGRFTLTPEGLRLDEIMPGIDLQTDILDVADAEIIIPPNGPALVESRVVTGRDFRLSL